ncbi:MAG: hypothetical protein ACI9UQ_000045, partial [Candidatus Krumholzibacteriia bacterium]
ARSRSWHLYWGELLADLFLTGRAMRSVSLCKNIFVIRRRFSMTLFRENAGVYNQ